MSKSKKTAKSTKPAQTPKTRRGGKQPAAPPVIPKALQTPEFAAAWADWQRFHAERGIALTAENTARQLKLLARFGPEEAVEDIRKTLEELPSPGGVGQMAEVTTQTDEVANSEPAAEQPTPAPTVEEAEVAPAEAAPPPAAPMEPDATEIAPAATETTETPLQATPVAEPSQPPKRRTAAKAPRPAGQLSALDAAAQVLATSGQPLSCQQLIDAMAAQGLWSSPKGKTPAGTLYSAIMREQKTKGTDARFVKAERGRFAHRASV